MDTQQIETTLHKLLKTVERMESDLIEDRTKIDALQHNLDSLESHLKTLEGRLPRLEDKIADAVEDGVTRAMEPLNNAIIPIDKSNRKWLYNAVQAIKGWGVKK